ncbi:WD40-repeat-containing domain protein [Lipomyces tetrasporus]|uniref:WD40-repeat-containing domain protein n=1 Tax=Lipomyces tetrasporus TaxID=54092 RepID=A0AAD7VNQ6_9ASCO|nr:WD40-repeat-containing domain protein [Lipomyces tetrasporus]KAJ8096502.1 WD40-repeat-containing domain protein [Lipomyces tetrasporus]
MPDFKLSRTLEAHKGDVRGVIFPKPGLIASVSRDCTLRTWKHLPGSAGSQYGVEWGSEVTYQSPKYLNSIAWMEDTKLIASAGLAQEITVSPPGANQPPEYVLKGHDSNVCALDYNSGVLISGSWDKTARVWVDRECKYILRGHEQAVWAVLVVAQDQYVTGSADKTIRLWSSGTTVRVYTGHTDVVRCICRIRDDRFASCSNDGSVRIWDFKGSCVAELYGHSSFVYSLAYSPATDEIVSCSEDRSVRVWKDGECVQTISLPCTSVWAVAINSENGDIAAGGSDGTVRVFSRSETSWATKEEIAKFDEQVAGYAISTNEVGNINKEKLPSHEALEVPGTKIGQVIMVKTAYASVDAYQWTGEKWAKIGEVVSGVGSQQKQIYEGQEYDYVFDVDIQEGAPPLKLPYNATENPYMAAQRFLEKNELPLSYLDETAKFIEKNTGGVKIGTQTPLEDPYGSRYIPGEQSSSLTSSQQVPVASEPKRVRFSLFPQKTFLYIKKANVPMLMKKIEEFNATKDPSLTVSSVELSEASKLMAASDSGLDSESARKVASLALRIVRQWPAVEKLGGLDILRVVVGELDDGGTVSEILSVIFNTPGIFDVSNNAMMATRLFVNLFQSEIGKSIIQQPDTRETILDHCRALIGPSISKLTEVALATLVLNFSVLVVSDNDLETAFSVIGIITEYLSIVKDPEAAYRLIVAFGTVLTVGSPEIIEAGKSLDGTKIVHDLKSRIGVEKRIETASDDVLHLLK